VAVRLLAGIDANGLGVDDHVRLDHQVVEFFVALFDLFQFVYHFIIPHRNYNTAGVKAGIHPNQTISYTRLITFHHFLNINSYNKS